MISETNPPCQTLLSFPRKRESMDPRLRGDDISRGLGLFMDGVLPAGTAEFFDFYLILFSFAARKMVILVFAVRARHDDGDSLSHVTR